MKTPEQLAADYATSQFPDEGPQRAVWRMCRDDFLAAYEAAKPKWISVKERLPEEGQDVLVCVNGQVLINYVHGIKECSSEWGLAENGETLWPTHWMPLPEAPKE